MSFKLPTRGLIFWPVANGDSTTVVIDSKTHLQVDLNHLERSEDDEDPTWSIVDELVTRLPKKDERPYLAAFALTHPDQDHCRGFAKLLDEVDVGELWFTPRVFREYKKDLCDDAEAFKKEAERRVKKTIDAKGMPSAMTIVASANVLPSRTMATTSSPARSRSWSSRSFAALASMKPRDTVDPDSPIAPGIASAAAS